MGCKDALDDPDGVYRNSDGLLVRVEPRSLTWAELLGSTLTRRPSELLQYLLSCVVNQKLFKKLTHVASDIDR